MDSVSDKEIESIWQRMKRYIDTNRIKGESQEEILQNIEDFLKASSTRESRGSMDRLLNKGFMERLPEVKSIQTELKEYIKFDDKGFGDGERKIDLPKVKKTKNVNKIAITTGKGTRVYSRANIRVSYAEFKGKPSYYIYNTRTKKRITWGVVN
jgi:hypothetical protein